MNYNVEYADQKSFIAKLGQIDFYFVIRYYKKTKDFRVSHWSISGERWYRIKTKRIKTKSHSINELSEEEISTAINNL